MNGPAEDPDKWLIGSMTEMDNINDAMNELLTAPGHVFVICVHDAEPDMVAVNAEDRVLALGIDSVKSLQQHVFGGKAFPADRVISYTQFKQRRDSWKNN